MTTAFPFKDVNKHKTTNLDKQAILHMHAANREPYQCNSFFVLCAVIFSPHQAWDDNGFTWYGKTLVFARPRPEI